MSNKPKENRVTLQYKVETNGAEKTKEIPHVSLVMSNLSGMPKEPLKPIEERKIEEIDHETFDRRMKAIQPRFAGTVKNTLTGDGQLSVELFFEKMDDFSPAAVASRIPGVKELLEARTQLANLKANLDGKADAEKLLQSLLSDSDLLRSLTQQSTETDNAPA